jgi:RNA polymerase sigma-70 factor, ECF subfamily
MDASDTHRAIEAVWQIESARLIAGLARVVRDVGLAEDLAQEALVAALAQWPSSGVPDNPGAWLMAIGKRRGVDLLRRKVRGDRKYEELGRDLAMQQAATAGGSASNDDIGDDLLRLVFICCHPVLSTDARVALTLRLLGGLTTEEIARAFLVPEPTVAQRIVRAKRTLTEARVPFEVPGGDELAARLSSVLEVIYLIFNEGYTASSGERLMREELCAEAIRLGRQLYELMLDEPEVMGLLALMLLIESRRAARVSADGDLVLLAHQDRSRWNRALVHEGQVLIRHCLKRNEPGPYQLQAAINAVHSDAASAADTDWRQILLLYNQQMAIAPSPIVALHRAVAVAEVEGPHAALMLVDALDLDRYYLFHAIRADLLRRLGRIGDAGRAYDAALARGQNTAEREFLQRRRAQLEPS